MSAPALPFVGVLFGAVLVASTAAHAADPARADKPLVLKSRSVALPPDNGPFTGTGVDVLNANCLACHAATMVLTQPPMTPTQWRATVVKMRDVYKAPLAEADFPSLVTALSGMGRR